MSKRDVRTADTEKSIWLNLPEDVFRQHLVNLEERTNAVPTAPQVFAASAWFPTSPFNSDTSYLLPLETEQQLVDDIAYLAAVEEGAQSVAAVCIEQHPQAPMLRLRFAALDTSLDDAVKSFLQETSTILARAAGEPEIASSGCIDALFQHVIQLHSRRLLARLRSIKWDKPQYLSKSHKKPLWQDFPNLIHRAQFVYAKKEKASRVLAEKLLGELAAVYESFENTHDDKLVKLQDLVNASLTFCSTGAVKDYINRLESSVGSTPTSQVGAAIKSLRQIQKIAACRRICIFLINTAKSYPNLFKQEIAMAYLTPYRSVPASIGYETWATTCHVHAEIQLAVHYDLASQSENNKQDDKKKFLRPRAIGTSKSLCYLCYMFLRAHGAFFPSRTHGRLYDQWTVPDLAEFGEELVLRYRELLVRVDGEVVRHARCEPVLWRLEPMTSVDVYCDGSVVES